jgi:hypothetical protein
LPQGPDDDDLPPPEVGTDEGGERRSSALAGDPARSGSVDISVDTVDADEETTDVAERTETGVAIGGRPAPAVTQSEADADEPAYSGPERRSQPQIQYLGRERRQSMRRAAEKVEDVVSGGVGKVGAGIGKLGGGMAKLGDKLPGVRGTKIGHGVKELGEGLTELGDSLTELPKVTRTRRGRVLVRSLFVGFLLVAGWIAVIVYFQLRGGEKPDLRPRAEQIMVQLRDGHYRKLFDESSPRFQEITDYDRFEADMKDMNATLGRFREIASVNDTVVTRGPGGLIARVELQLDFDSGRARGSISLHWDEGRWKLLGVGVDVPDTLYATATSKPAREKRSEAPPEIRAAAEKVLEQVRDGKADAIWEAAAPLFRESVSKADFLQIEVDRARILGRYRRLLSETTATKSPGGSSAWLTALVEYDNANVTVTFGFTMIAEAWKLTSYKVVLPMPRAPRAPGEGSGSGSESETGSSVP